MSRIEAIGGSICDQGVCVRTFSHIARQVEVATIAGTALQESDEARLIPDEDVTLDASARDKTCHPG